MVAFPWIRDGGANASRAGRNRVVQCGAESGAVKSNNTEMSSWRNYACGNGRWWACPKSSVGRADFVIADYVGSRCGNSRSVWNGLLGRRQPRHLAATPCGA